MGRKRKPTHPGVILNEHYIKPLKLNLQKLADRLGITRNTLFKIREGKASVTPSIALSLADAFDLFLSATNPRHSGRGQERE